MNTKNVFESSEIRLNKADFDPFYDAARMPEIAENKRFNNILWLATGTIILAIIIVSLAVYRSSNAGKETSVMANLEAMSVTPKQESIAAKEQDVAPVSLPAVAVDTSKAIEPVANQVPETPPGVPLTSENAQYHWCKDLMERHRTRAEVDADKPRVVKAIYRPRSKSASVKHHGKQKKSVIARTKSQKRNVARVEKRPYKYTSNHSISPKKPINNTYASSNPQSRQNFLQREQSLWARCNGSWGKISGCPGYSYNNLSDGG